MPAPTIMFPTNDDVWKNVRMLKSESIKSDVETAAGERGASTTVSLCSLAANHGKWQSKTTHEHLLKDR